MSWCHTSKIGDLNISISDETGNMTINQNEAAAVTITPEEFRFVLEKWGRVMADVGYRNQS